MRDIQSEDTCADTMSLTVSKLHSASGRAATLSLTALFCASACLVTLSTSSGVWFQLVGACGGVNRAMAGSLSNSENVKSALGREQLENNLVWSRENWAGGWLRLACKLVVRDEDWDNWIVAGYLSARLGLSMLI
jgi:hypothetical protein